MSDRAPVTHIRNLGPAMAERFAQIGIDYADQIYQMGAHAAYAKLLEAGERPHFIAYYSLVMGVQGRPWNDLNAEEKARLREKFDALKQNKRSSGKYALERDLEHALDQIGVIEKGNLRVR